jgi:transcriptional regulator with XRE-family HTH domain
VPSNTAGRSRGPEYREMGERLRFERRARSMSLRELAERLGVSASLISQVETGRATPSVSTLYAIANELDVSLDDLLFNTRRSARDAPPESRDTAPATTSTASGPVQRGESRKRIRLASGVIWERLTTASEPEAEFLYVIYEVGGASSPESEFQRHAGHEWGHVLAGKLTVTIGFDEYLLGPGDSISIDSTVPHRLANHGDEPVHGIWFVMGRQGGAHAADRREDQPAEWHGPMLQAAER